MDYFKERVCKHCGEIWRQYNSLDKCKCQRKQIEIKRSSFASKIHKPIKRVSDKKTLDDIIYKSERIKFLMLPENKICPITKQPTTDVHHSKGRVGSLYLDKKYWIALSREGHKFVEENPILAKENGFSLNRLTND